MIVDVRSQLGAHVVERSGHLLGLLLQHRTNLRIGASVVVLIGIVGGLAAALSVDQINSVFFLKHSRASCVKVDLGSGRSVKLGSQLR